MEMIDFVVTRLDSTDQEWQPHLFMDFHYYGRKP